MQKPIDDVITERPIGVAENAVIQQVRKRGGRAIQRRFSERPPVRFVKDQVEIRCAQRAKPRIFQDKDAIVEDKSGAERVGVGKQDEQRQGSEGKYRP
jgi:hypothetical protein